MKTNALRLLAAALLAWATVHAQVPQLLNYQGRVAVGMPPVNFDGSGSFKFALVNAAGDTTYWSNDGTSTAGSQPTAAVALTVTKGLYSVLLGDTSLANMTAIPATVFDNADVRLRVWFNDGANGSQLLTPDQRIAAVGYAMKAENAALAQSVPDGAITAAQIADFAITNSKLAFGAEVGAASDGVLGASGGTLTFTGTFDYPFSAAPEVALQSPGWTLGAVSGTGFSASIAFAPVEVDNSSSVGTDTSLAVLADGHPAISYFNAAMDDLVFVRATDASGTAWGTPVTVDSAGGVGNWNSLAVVNGNPAISYRDFTNFDLKYVRATLPDGSAWGTPITIDGVGDVGTYTSLAVVNGRPAIAYRDGTNAALKYVRADDADGSAWTTPPVTIPDPANVGVNLSLVVVDGFPAISYYDQTTADLKYVRATDADGAAWGTPVAVDTAGGVGQWSSMAIVAGRPAISYNAQGVGDLRFVRASGADGSTWGAPATLDSTGNVGRYTSLVVVDGRPAISYYDVTNGDLKFVQATAADGSAWGTPLTLDSTGDVGQWTSLAVVGGNAAISYHDVTNTALKYVTVPTLRWTASDGTVAPLVAVSVAQGAIGSTQLGSDLTLAGTTIGTFSGALSGNATGFTGSLAGDVTGTQGATVVANVGGVTASNVATGANLANAATSTSTNNALVKRDGSGSFSSKSITLAGNLNLPTTAAGGSAGLISQDGNPLIHTFGTSNFFAGSNAGNLTMTGGLNTAIGNGALLNNTTGHSNTATGRYVLASNETGDSNTANGRSALASNTSGSDNTASGVYALVSNTTAGKNVAIGRDALRMQDYDNGGTPWDSNNVAVGVEALYSNNPLTSADGTNNTAIGTQALFTNSYGGNNTASGFQALFTNDTGDSNTASGFQALFLNDTGNYNTASGEGALFGNKTGSGNTASGFWALVNSHGDGNIAVGKNAGISLTMGDDNIYIGNSGVDGESGIIRIGTNGTHTKTFLAGNVGIGTSATASYPLEVVGSVARVDTYTYFGLSNSALVFQSSGSTANTSIKASNEILASHFSAYSDERIKDILGRSDRAADLGTLLQIEITDYHYKDKIDKGARAQKKVIAQQVEKVFPQAVSRTTGVVPDIFREAPIKDGWVSLATDLKPGERVRLITEQGHRAVHEVLEVGKDRFRTDFTEDAGRVFVYGREVDDFRSVDYEAIAMLNVSATQELAREVEAQRAENASLKARLAELKAKDAARDAREKQRDAKLAAIEELLRANAAPAVRTAVFQNAK